MAQDASHAPIAEVLDRLEEAAQGETVSVDDVMEALGGRSLPALLLAPALVVITPASGIPLLSSVCGISIALIAAAALLARRQAWLPRWIRRRRADAARLRKGIDWMRGPADWVDRRTRPRLAALFRPPLDRLPLALCLLCGLAMPALELVPFTSSLLGLACALLAISVLVRDGLFATLGGAVVLVAAAVPLFVAT
ncbi:MAG: exopolysaccharide biosynthesis protein [Albimonas sp.]|uniref:exopolysaccharide biosynthesis protein n=1 Tax=Albimonas sp. TaxID=1872425 RepID=UPI00405634B5